MNPKLITKSLHTLIESKQPVFLWGPPGVGKSQIVAQVAERLNYKLTDLRAVLLDPVDLRGLPRISSEGDATWCPPSFLPKTGEGILFLDELNAAPPLVQAACYQLVLDRKIGEYELPEGWVVIAAGNRESDKAVTHRMPSALANRFVHLDFETSVKDWLDWAERNNIAEELRSFIKFRPNLLHDFDPARNEKAFPSPRSWEFVSGIIKSNPAPEIEYELFKGTVGEGAAAEFYGFCKIYRKLPDPEFILKSPDKAAIPEDPATIYALCESIASKASPENAENIMTFATRLPAEFAVLLVRNAVKKDRSIVDSAGFTSWATANSDILF
ncbi:AAA family ATPase [Maridesulfovibrio hydrothermalis]|uniref:ATPase associated with various cellular activities AAA_3 n=1 Tax=Maridesulfovibrio hydrothermalis AM13 = DSM 14728 TaxID=1121451 RepID=L0RFG1_9BACT|nr:MoxR family ATPase [Maridesulfovibrio hydrothermalis]CCO24920.1 ATPase associated with various cellular activities AAA_3 [Maridesulfovibrio hydrothermalis AM13 = DSM 14728]